jgi:hypothetical protein
MHRRTHTHTVYLICAEQLDKHRVLENHQRCSLEEGVLLLPRLHDMALAQALMKAWVWVVAKFRQQARFNCEGAGLV